MAKKKVEQDDGHRMGKRCGYTLLPNGDIKVAPMYRDQFAALNHRKAAVRLLIEAVHSLSVPIADDEKRIWEAMADDYSIDVLEDWCYREGVLTKRQTR